MKTVGELLVNSPDDKHFIVGETVEFFPKKRLIKINLQNNNPLCVLKKDVDPELLSVEELITAAENVQKNFSDFKEQNDFLVKNILLSSGTILLFGKEVESAFVPLLKRDLGAPSDASRLTMTAGRLDSLLNAGNYSELFEEMVVFGKSDGKDVIFIPKIPPNIKLPFDSKEVIRKAAARGGVPGASDREIIFVENEAVEMDMLWQVDMYIDSDLVETSRDIYLCPDWENNTLEFRQIIMLDLPIEKGGPIEGIADGDGFGREISVISVKELMEYHEAIISSKIDLIDLILKSNNDYLVVAATTEPVNGGIFGRFFWNAKQPGQFFVSTVSHFIESLM